MSNNDRIEKRFYPNGQLETEITHFEGLERCWVTRHWHPNGILESEVPVKNGLTEGVARFWNQKGELIGTYEMHDGSGVQKGWHPDGSLMAEISWVNGERTGRQRSYFEGGELAVETYWVRGQQFSKKKYLAACLEDPSLPRYEATSKAGLPKTKRKRTTRAAVKQGIKEDFNVDAMLSAPGTMEVLEWLRSGQPGTRTLGELPSHEASIEVAKEIYALGAIKVWAVEINKDDPELEGTGKLIVSLPKAPAVRAHVLKWCAEWAERKGYEPESDVGQDHVFVMLD
jgi:hypothetical protein